VFAEGLSYLTWHIKKLKRDHGFRALESAPSPEGEGWGEGDFQRRY
jgi:hypothetical protein